MMFRLDEVFDIFQIPKTEKTKLEVYKAKIRTAIRVWLGITDINRDVHELKLKVDRHHIRNSIKEMSKEITEDCVKDVKVLSSQLSQVSAMARERCMLLDQRLTKLEVEAKKK